MYFDEDLILNIRLNCLNKYVDKFVIVESIFNHKGIKRKPKFKINKFKKFKKKIKYVLLKKQPKNLQKILKNDNEEKKTIKYIMNAVKRENFQRNMIKKGLTSAKDNDLILISDIDEIPNLKNINFKKIKEKIILFNQMMIYYKFNLKLNNLNWYGTKACKLKNLKSPQWLRNIKDKAYPKWRLDTFFSEKKYQNIKFIKNGGWHFTYIKTPKEIEKKLKSYLHHREYDLNPIGIKKIKNIIKNKKAIYNLKLDQRSWNKIGTGEKLKKINFKFLPNFIHENKKQFSKWLED
tara:strand:+ start:99 stop:974 length:876 start_codon:yes stop_codon:yes gene_type:complete